jgi:hypothetical protein
LTSFLATLGSAQPTGQTDGKLLADRALLRLLHEDWPTTLELEERRPAATPPAAGPKPRMR